MVKFFGLDKELVKDAIIHDILSHQVEYRLFDTEGKIVEKRGKLFYKTKLMGETTEILLGDTLNGKLDLKELSNLNSENIKFAVVSKDGKQRLFLSVGETSEDAQERLDWQIVEDYADKLNVKSKLQLQNLIKQYQKDHGFLMKNIRPIV